MQAECSGWLFSASWGDSKRLQVRGVRRKVRADRGGCESRRGNGDELQVLPPQKAGGTSCPSSHQESTTATTEGELTALGSVPGHSPPRRSLVRGMGEHGGLPKLGSGCEPLYQAQSGLLQSGRQLGVAMRAHSECQVQFPDVPLSCVTSANYFTALCFCFHNHRDKVTIIPRLHHYEDSRGEYLGVTLSAYHRESADKFLSSPQLFIFKQLS